MFHEYVTQQQPPKEIVDELAPILTDWAKEHPTDAKILNLELH